MVASHTVKYTVWKIRLGLHILHILQYRHGGTVLYYIYIPFLANYPLRTPIGVLSESIRKKTLILKFLRIPYTHGVFRHFSTSLRRVPRWWRGPAVARGTSGGRSASPKVLEPPHFRAKHHRRNQYLTVHIWVHFSRHSNGRQEHDLGLRFVEDRFGYKLVLWAHAPKFFKKWKAIKF